MVAMQLDLYKASGADLIMGAGRFIAPKTIGVGLNDGGARVPIGDRVVLNLGTHATIPDTPGLAAAKPLTNVEALELDRLPDHLVVIGGGYVGLEMAQAYRRFGSRVTIIEAGPQLAGREDSDVATALLEMLRDEGIKVHLGTKVLGVQGRSGQSCIRPQAIRPSKAATSWPGPGAPPIPKGSGSSSPVSRSTQGDMSRSTTGSKRARPTSGRLASAPAVHNSPMCRPTTSASSARIWLVAIALPAAAWSPIVCSPTRRWRGSG